MEQEIEKLEVLLSAFQIKCRGIDKNNKHVFSENEAEQAVIKVYKNGRTESLCRCKLYDFGAEGRCNPHLNKIDVSSAKEDFGFCPYCSKL